ncbi:MAG: 2OG-Fe(II) oxygenase [Candidatus Sericytochromatia bacterium]|nr:2OG-Fe(II) oxygenase [Candidatus Sericytochromatia bacterium]
MKTDINETDNIKSIQQIKEKLLKEIIKNFYCKHDDVLSVKELRDLKQNILNCKYLAVNNLNRDFISTKGFSLVFKASGIEQVKKQFPFFNKYLELALDPYCNAFYLNPLLMNSDTSRVDSHIDRSLRSYLKTIETPLIVSVMYVEVPENIIGGELVLSHNKKNVGQIKPKENTLVYFQGHLTHSVNQMKVNSNRLSLVCEQYRLEEDELRSIPEFKIESRKLKY